MFAPLALLSSLLIGQTLSVPPQAAAAEIGPTPALAPPLAPTQSKPAARTEQRPSFDNERSREILTDLMASRTGGAVTGRPAELVTVLGSTSDNKARFQIVQAYWRLVQRVADYNSWLDRHQQLESLRVASHVSLLAKAVRASSAAALREAELAVLAAQYELAAAAGLSSASPLSLPADLPHVGSYQTRFNDLFSGRSVPARARLLDQTLPLRLETIEARAAAVHAAHESAVMAQDALRVAQEALHTEQESRRLEQESRRQEVHWMERTDLMMYLSCVQEVRLQQAAFMAAVCQYNIDIADYVLNIVSPQVTAQNLVEMLITTAHKAPAEPSGEGKKESGGESPATVRPRLYPPDSSPPSTFRER